MTTDFARFDPKLALAWLDEAPARDTMEVKHLVGSSNLKPLTARLMNEVGFFDFKPQGTLTMVGCQPPHILPAREAFRRIKDIKLGAPND